VEKAFSETWSIGKIGQSQKGRDQLVQINGNVREMSQRVRFWSGSWLD
jgi:hypothetical protein